MEEIKNGGLDQYGAEPFEQQQFGTSGIEGVNISIYLHPFCLTIIHCTVLHLCACFILYFTCTEMRLVSFLLNEYVMLCYVMLIKIYITDMDEAGSDKHHRQGALKLERVADFRRCVRVSPESVGEIADDHSIVDRCNGRCEKQP